MTREELEDARARKQKEGWHSSKFMDYVVEMVTERQVRAYLSDQDEWDRVDGKFVTHDHHDKEAVSVDPSDFQRVDMCYMADLEKTSFNEVAKKVVEYPEGDDRTLVERLETVEGELVAIFREMADQLDDSEVSDLYAAHKGEGEYGTGFEPTRKDLLSSLGTMQAIASEIEG